MLIMKYRTADYLRSFIYALSLENGERSFSCALLQRDDNSDEWMVYLYDRDECWNTTQDLYVLAKAIISLVPTLVVTSGVYDAGTRKGDRLLDAIVIW